MRIVSGALLGCVVALALWPQSAVAANQLLGLRLAHGSDQLWRLVLDCAETPDYEYSRLENPPRLIVDFADTELPEHDRMPVLQGSPISALRLTRRADGSLRLVAELASAVQPKFLRLAADGIKPHRLALLLHNGVAAGALQIPVPGDAGASEVVVVIDAGHGGYDPGAVSASGLREKDVVLAVAEKLHRRLNSEPGFSALLTRAGDQFISLDARSRIARTHRAALFLSIHADSIPKGSLGRPRGAALYMLSGEEASSREAYFLSQRENQSGRPQLAGLALEQQPAVVRSVLYDLSLDASRQRATVIAQALLRVLSKAVRLHKKRVEQADFAVLRAPDVPSLLVELGFLSNAREARRLAGVEHQNRLVEALFSGVRDFFVRQPPEDSWLAWRSHNVGLRYTVRAGESLWLLARRYGTSVEAIMRHNGIATDADVLQEGRALLIPAAKAAAVQP